MKSTLAIIMAGGKGERLMPLTRHRAKPAISFGGIYRLIDITLSNCVNSGLYKIMVLPQYRSRTLMQHLEMGWNIFSPALGHFLHIIPPQMTRGEQWYLGTADSIRQNMELIELTGLSYCLVLSGDHVYKMDYQRFQEYHVENRADVTIAAIEVGKEFAGSYGILEVDKAWQVIGFQEKPKRPKTIPGDESHVLASMGIYLFNTEILLDILKMDERPDFGKDIIPSILGKYKVFGYPFRKENKIKDIVIEIDPVVGRREILVEKAEDSSYWRDVGTLDAYWNSNMDLTGERPYFNLYGRLWPIRTYQMQYPPSKTALGYDPDNRPKSGEALDSLVAHGCVIVGGVVRNSVLSYNVYVQEGALVEESVLLEDVVIGKGAKVKKAIIGDGAFIPPGMEIGYRPREDMKRFTVTPRGITVVTRDDLKAL